MFNLRIYRTALVPFVLAVLYAAFAFQDRPAAIVPHIDIAPDAFNSQGTLAEIKSLAAQFPNRSPGSGGDQALAKHMQRSLSANGMSVSVNRFQGATAMGRRELTNVVGVKPGLSDRQVVVMAHRDALSAPATAEL